MVYQKFANRYTNLENPFKGSITLSSGGVGKFIEGRGVNCKAQKSTAVAAGFFGGVEEYKGAARPNGDGSLNLGEKEAEFFKTLFIVLTACVLTNDSE